MGKQHKILYVSHPQKECGVYQFGKRIGKVLQTSAAFQFIYVECADEHELCQAVTETKPAAIIYNYYPTGTFPWLNINTTKQFGCPQLGMLHEVTQSLADSADNTLFNYHIAPDPTLLLKNPIVFKTGRLVTAFHNRFPQPSTTTIGSFGFGADQKGVEALTAIVQDSYENAIIRLHLPHAKFGDADGSKARAIVARCSSLLYKTGIKLEVSHDFMEEDQLLDFLAQNTVNAFLYKRTDVRGISSVIDYALAVQRPIAIRRSGMFRHIWDARPSVCIEDQPLEKIIANGPRVVERFAREWSEPNLLWDYERIIRKVLSQDPPPLRVPGLRGLPRRVLSRVKKKVFPKRVTVTSKPIWIEKTDITVDTSSWGISEGYQPVRLDREAVFNRILDHEARTTYRPAIAKLFKLVPDLMARKIPEANAQQAFTLDTVVRFAKGIRCDPKILSIGSFEDSAVWGLRALNFQVDEVDPVLNFELGEFMQRPTTRLANYDIIFSVSVIEHVEDDAEFLIQIGQLLKPGGIAVLTCDYNDQYVVGDPKPSVDWRLYTQNDFRTRLLPRIPDCELVDLPRWDCLKPDFQWEGCAYTFASLVFRKK